MTTDHDQHNPDRWDPFRDPRYGGRAGKARADQWLAGQFAMTEADIEKGDAAIEADFGQKIHRMAADAQAVGNVYDDSYTAPNGDAA